MFPSTPDQVVAAQESSVGYWFTLTNIAVEGLQRLTELNLQTARTTVADSQDNVRALFAGRDLRDVFAVQANLAQPAAEKAIAYARNVYEIASNTQAELTKAVEARYEQHSRNMQSFVDTFVKNAPAGSEAITALLQSSVAAASSTYQSIQSAAKQTAEAAGARFVTTAVAASGAAQQAGARAPRQ
ncbi:phasin family protein [Cupriavidus pinatubonensis]|uniref:phasin family protein n=1 Tax=Cupriavidus pinatubonensis TaxID=248026 RepID=UPI00112EA061|nr:phasin family protein [Cupriavidus pinatubonensis]TPQ42453.1 phasin [Cupriavidus pinatubonensis]